MRYLFRFLILFATIYAVATASPHQQVAMMEGAGAFVGSYRDACLRTEPCAQAARSVQRLVASATSVRVSHQTSPPLLER